jgi:hypothetical protein
MTQAHSHWKSRINITTKDAKRVIKGLMLDPKEFTSEFYLTDNPNIA